MCINICYVYKYIVMRINKKQEKNEKFKKID